MEINRITTGYHISDIKPQKPHGGVEPPVSTQAEIQDAVDLKSGREAQSPSRVLFKALQKPSEEIRPARNQAPVVIVHGTMADKNSIKNYMDAALQSGHPVDLDTYMTIKEGEQIQKSAGIVSQKINQDRMEITGENLRKLKEIKDDPDQLKEFFLMDDNLYGMKDERTHKILSLIPGVIDNVDQLMNSPKEELKNSFSGKTRQIEKELANQVYESGFGTPALCEKVAGEIMDTISPKAILVGHSMGGFVSYTITLNPKEKVGDDNQFTYDGGNGVGMTMTLSSPVKSGVTSPVPSAISDLSYNLAEKHWFNPIEGTPGMQLAMMNPFFSMWYSANKEWLKISSRYTTEMMSQMTNPLIYMQKPGYQQIAEGSSFIKDYIRDKPVPNGVSVIAVSNKIDGVSEQTNSRVDDSRPNAHNLDADVVITPEELSHKYISTAPSMAHIKMPFYPNEHWKEFMTEVMSNPHQIPRVLDKSNYDGLRWNCLQVLLDKAQKEPDIFKSQEFKPVLSSIQNVAEERLPFKDSPSYTARQVLDVLKGKDINPDPKINPGPGTWILSETVDPFKV